MGEQERINVQYSIVQASKSLRREKLEGVKKHLENALFQTEIMIQKKRNNEMKKEILERFNNLSDEERDVVIEKLKMQLEENV